jgi:hypothetical protein
MSGMNLRLGRQNKRIRKRIDSTIGLYIIITLFCNKHDKEMKENKSSKASGVIIKIVLFQVTNEDIPLLLEGTGF